MDSIAAACNEYDIPLLEDAARSVRGDISGAAGRFNRSSRRFLVQREQDHHDDWWGDVGCA